MTHGMTTLNEMTPIQLNDILYDAYRRNDADYDTFQLNDTKLI